jgi:hypothetical protein
VEGRTPLQRLFRGNERRNENFSMNSLSPGGSSIQTCLDTKQGCHPLSSDVCVTRLAHHVRDILRIHKEQRAVCPNTNRVN